MPMKRYKPEQIVTLLRQIEVEIANGKTTPHACKEAQITVQTYYRWRKEFGGLKLDQAKRMKDLAGGAPFDSRNLLGGLPFAVWAKGGRLYASSFFR